MFQDDEFSEEDEYEASKMGAFLELNLDLLIDEMPELKDYPKKEMLTLYASGFMAGLEYFREIIAADIIVDEVTKKLEAQMKSKKKQKAKKTTKPRKPKS